MKRLQICAAAQALQWVFQIHRVAEQNDGVAHVLEPLCRHVFQLFDEAHDGDRRCGIDWAGRTLIV